MEKLRRPNGGEKIFWWRDQVVTNFGPTFFYDTCLAKPLRPPRLRSQFLVAYFCFNKKRKSEQMEKLRRPNQGGKIFWWRDKSGQTFDPTFFFLRDLFGRCGLRGHGQSFMLLISVLTSNKQRKRWPNGKVETAKRR